MMLFDECNTEAKKNEEEYLVKTHTQGGIFHLKGKKGLTVQKNIYSMYRYIMFAF